MPKKLSLIVPAYNKDKEVFEVVSSQVKLLKQLDYDWEIIVVDDASRDHTLREAVRSKKFNGNSSRIKIFSYNLNQGKGFALNYGFSKSCGDIIIFADADLDLPSSNIKTLLDYFENSGADIALGSKRHHLSRVHYPLIRRSMSKIYQMLTTLLFGLEVSDTQVGLKVFKRHVLSDSLPRLSVKHFAFDLELLVVASSLGYKKISETPIVLDYNFTSTISMGAIRRIVMDTLFIYYRKNLLRYYRLPHNHLQKSNIKLKTPQAYI